MKAVEYILVISFLILACGGYIGNVVQITNHISEPITVMILLRIIGIFAFPLGIILGFL